MSLFRTKPVTAAMESGDAAPGEYTLKRVLTARHLVMLGIGAVIGAGIFVLTGNAAANHPGPAGVLSLDEASERTYIKELCAAEVELVVLAGFMRVLKAQLLEAFQGRIINIHPSLLPSFPGLQAWKQALEYGVKVTGCTVHFVDAGVDSGPIIGQQAVAVLDRDTPETLHARIQVAEHELYPRWVAALARNELTVVSRRVMARHSVSGPVAAC